VSFSSQVYNRGGDGTGWFEIISSSRMKIYVYIFGESLSPQTTLVILS